MRGHGPACAARYEPPTRVAAPVFGHAAGTGRLRGSMSEGHPEAATPRRTVGHLRWDWIDARLHALREVWVATADVSGRPDAVPVWFWWDGAVLFFSTHPLSAKARNLERQAAIVVHNGDGAAPIIIRGSAEAVYD